MRLLPERRHHDRQGFLDKNPKATEAEIQQAMSGVLCRCFTNVRMLGPSSGMRKGGRDE